MSMAALRWVRPLSVTSTQKVILWAMADQADDEGQCWPSVAGLMEATCLSERALRDALRTLEAAGILSTEVGGGRNRTSTYRLLMTVNPASGSNTRQQAPRIEGDLKGASGSEKGRHVPKRGRLAPERGRHVPPNPQEPSSTLKEPIKAACDPCPSSIALPAWLPQASWADWCRHREMLSRKGWTYRAAELCLRNLATLRDQGDDPTKILEQSIASGWTGLFPLKNRTPTAKPEFRNGFFTVIARDREREADAARIAHDDDEPNPFLTLEAPRRAH